ncbi:MULTISPECIES: potassium-transporting ATPase subunit KdpA [Gordonibacter]|uniref:Potassium-transporting ATPase potassium-binding subunit n=2 Tax=Gordonibacter TaxID=644652 RepID=A0ABT7DLK0_9ACTN|nr:MULTISPECIES: potassium-transporting ATPase subunit KdpA [unclassified Gordonibacter]MDJ1650410.1 potassium-transporting ATPase subunit KdpA [Gordonibacter sp. KGMB12511]
MDELLEYGVYLALLVALALPLSAYLNRAMAGERTVLSRVLVPVENLIYRGIHVDKRESMGWKTYLINALAFSAVSLVGLFALLMLQGVLPGNPEGLPGLSWDLAFNTAVSFVTNTNWQAYSGEAALSYLSQALGLTVQNFVTPAVGLAVLFALFRGLVSEGERGLGNFFVDVTRALLFVLLPLSLVVALADVWQGSPQNLAPYEEVQLLEPVGVTAEGDVVAADDPAAVDTIDQAVVPLGPQASQVAIKQLGTNGGGYNGVNSASALENPTPLTNLIQCLSLLLLPVTCVFSFGRFVAGRRQGRALFAAMFILLVAGLVAIAVAEQLGTPQLAADGQVYMGLDGQSGGNMEGKETRFGVTDSSLWAAFTTAASNGAVNAMHDSFTPLGGMVPMILMALGEVVFGGVGCGLYGMIGFVLLTVFIAGLMVGRTPEYLGKKLGPKEMRMAAVLCVTTPLLILIGGTALCLDPATAASVNNAGPHGFSEVLYAAVSTGGNNGSAFAGFNANTPYINVVLALEMLANRFIPLAAVCVLAGSLCARPKVAVGAGTLSTSNALFVFLLILMVLLVGALTMFPALALGPVAEHLMMVL